MLVSLYLSTTLGNSVIYGAVAMELLITFHIINLMWINTFFSANMIAAVTVPIDYLIFLAVKEQWNFKGKNCLAWECSCFSDLGHSKEQEIWGLRCIYSWKDIHITLFLCHQYSRNSWSWQQSNAFCVVSPMRKPEFGAEAAKTKIKTVNHRYSNSPFCSDTHNFSISRPSRRKEPLVLHLLSSSL